MRKKENFLAHPVNDTAVQRCSGEQNTHQFSAQDTRLCTHKDYHLPFIVPIIN